MEITDVSIINKTELATRWNCSQNYINKLEDEGVITRLPINRCCYSLRQIMEIEGTNPNPEMVLLDYKRIKEENEKLKDDILELNKKLFKLKEIMEIW